MFYIILATLGLCLGSFVNALVWRLYEQQKAKKPNKELSILKGRSMCPHCKHTLAWNDLVPVLSWLSLGGKCRYCREPISWQYPLVEILTAVLFVISAIFWPVALAGFWAYVTFGLWLVLMTLFMAMTVYDLRWMILPDKLVLASFCVAIAIITITLSQDTDISLLDPLWGILCISGFFYVLYQLSGGKWIGGGDVKLGFVLGVLVGGPLKAMLVIFIASCIGSLVAIPILLAGKGGKKTKLPFGPLLLAATGVVYLFGTSIIGWYKSLTGIV